MPTHAILSALTTASTQSVCPCIIAPRAFAAGAIDIGSHWLRCIFTGHGLIVRACTLLQHAFPTALRHPGAGIGWTATLRLQVRFEACCAASAPGARMRLRPGPRLAPSGLKHACPPNERLCGPLRQPLPQLLCARSELMQAPLYLSPCAASRCCAARAASCRRARRLRQQRPRQPIERTRDRHAARRVQRFLSQGLQAVPIVAVKAVRTTGLQVLRRLCTNWQRPRIRACRAVATRKVCQHELLRVYLYTTYTTFCSEPLACCNIQIAVCVLHGQHLGVLAQCSPCCCRSSISKLASCQPTPALALLRLSAAQLHGNTAGYQRWQQKHSPAQQKRQPAALWSAWPSPPSATCC